MRGIVLKELDWSLADCRYGAMQYFADDDPIGKSLHLYGEWAQNEIDVLSRFIGKGSVVIDVGAHIGSHTLAFSRLVGRTGLVLAFEPQPTIYKILQANVDRNLLSNVEVYNVGVSNRVGKMYLPDIDYGGHSNLGGVSLSSVGDELSGAVDVKPLDDLNLDRIDLLKADVEGMEAYVVEGARSLIAKHGPVVFLECRTVDEFVPTASTMKALDYLPFFLSCSAFNPRNFRAVSQNMFGVAQEPGVIWIHGDDDASLAVAATLELSRLRTLEDLSRHLYEMPRYGDAHEFTRKPKVLIEKLAESEIQLDVLRETLRHTEEESAAALQRVAQMDANLVSLRQTSEREHAVLSTRLKQVESERDDAISFKSALQIQLKEKTLETHSLMRQLRQREEMAEAVLNSSIWKATYGLRRMLDRAKRAKRYVGLLRGQIANVVHLPHVKASFQLFRERQEILRSGFFDKVYYLAVYRDVAESGHDPVFHYLKYGSLEMRNPSARFNTEYYTSAHPEVLPTGINPLLYFLRNGRALGHRPAPETMVAPIDQLTQEDWDTLVLLAPRRGAPMVDVIVPVYKNSDLTLNCLYHVLKASSLTPYELIVIDDCSPEEDLSMHLQELADRGLFSLYRNETNLGFVSTVNKGMRLHSDRDVVLLNSDTEVYDGWLDRIVASANQDDRIGTVTPMSNNATICSYPVMGVDNSQPLEIRYSELDALAASANADCIIEIPTAVGFCMFIRRTCLEEVGLFDERAFGKGYGEENDFSVRAKRAGWINVLAGSVFVRHFGSASFGSEQSLRSVAGVNVLAERYPMYLSSIEEFFIRDPASEPRMKLDAARVSKAIGDKVILFVSHSRGGGTNRHMADLERLLKCEGVSVLYLHPVSSMRSASVFSTSDIPSSLIPNLGQVDCRGPVEDMVERLNLLGVQHIHIHSLVDFDPLFVDYLRVAAQRLNIPYDYTVHDYTPICPQINLIDASGQYCGEPEPPSCQECVNKLSSPFGPVSIWSWRDSYQRLLSEARCVFVPDDDVLQRMNNHFGNLNLVLRPHPEEYSLVGSEDLRGLHLTTRNMVLRVVVIGAIGPHKGSDVFLKVAREAEQSRAAVRFTVAGYTNVDDQLRALRNVDILGAYDESELPTLVRAGRYHLAWFPSVWPETFSYTFSAAVDAGVFPVAFNLGAIGARIARMKWGAVMPLEFANMPEKCLAFLLTVQPTPRTLRGDELTHAYSSTLHDYYGLD